MLLCVSKRCVSLRYLTTRHDVRPRAYVILDALIVALFTAIYRLATLNHLADKGYIAHRPASACL